MQTPAASSVVSRRQFVLGAASLAALAPFARAASGAAAAKPVAALPANAVIVFQGDSITDAGRDRKIKEPNDPAALANAYVGRIAEALLAGPAGAGRKIYNRGISGHRIVDLLGRWKSDTLVFQPDLVSILVGVNDTWHEFINGNGVPVPRYAQLYRMMLEDTRAARPACRLVLCEPFALPGGTFKDEWMPELRERMAVVRKLAQDFDATFVPFQAMFEAAMKKFHPRELAADGVHPSALGHQLMAECWLQSTGL